ncbi:hypothetical protein K2173_022866 [Erythroxylum novogranatense]|uniref:G-patch domain-containing protein n=1 Tax=Erythroxylum novogranatense TaxID=1862640 RepID=A0AAV8SMZ8_9ROSI|nr:hypothetical protein K2173_022866 [Erythroxylum novogranatense]
MARGTEEEHFSEIKGDGCHFVWDESTQLYFHSSSGFYHDPIAGWYYSSRDGCYYKFENGGYVLLESDRVHVYEDIPDNTVQDEHLNHLDCSSKENFSPLQADESDAEATARNVECSSGNQPVENLPPPSDWLEETLINIFLSRSKQAASVPDGSTAPLEVDGANSYELGADDAANDDYTVLERHESGRMREGHAVLTDTGGCFEDEELSKEEENWRAQYGQVIQSAETSLQNFPAVDLWDWEMVSENIKGGKDKMSKLVGRLVKQSARLHPSVASGGGLLRTAPICEVHLDLVRVKTGQVYKLHNPSARYLASLSTYDSSNPTKDWGFPIMSIGMQGVPHVKPNGASEPRSTVQDPRLSNQLSTSKEMRGHDYRDRAAERRKLHGGFGVGPGQKSASSTSPVYTSREEAAAEALDMSFGSGSYARKILENMGWKEGEALGNSKKGLIEPIHAIGNIGNAGLGWPKGTKKQLH